MREKRREEQLHNPHYLKGSTSSKSPRVSNDFVSYWYNLSLDNIISRSVAVSFVEVPPMHGHYLLLATLINMYE